MRLIGALSALLAIASAAPNQISANNPLRLKRATGQCSLVQCEPVCCNEGTWLDRTASPIQCKTNVCKCNYGTERTTNCGKHNNYECSDCDKFYRMVDLTCHPNTCFCNHGNAAHKCHEHEKEDCAIGSCHPGYHEATGPEYGERMVCVPNTCKCDNSKGLLQWKTDGIHVCTENDVSGALEDAAWQSMPYVRCNSGHACKKGYHYDHQYNLCLRNVCQCANGKKQRYPECDNHGANECASCDQYYHRIPHLTAPRCEPKVCKCEHGTKVLKCNVHDGGDCADENCKISGEDCLAGSCHPGYHEKVYPLTDGNTHMVCEPNVCKCGHADIVKTNKQSDCKLGVSSEWTTTGSTICNNNNGAQCFPRTACEKGYHYDQSTSSCKKNVCLCTNGIAVDFFDCERHESQHCKSCNLVSLKNGYVLDNRACVVCAAGTRPNSDRTGCVNNCKCLNGKPVDDICPITQHTSGYKCGSCDAGFHLDPVTFLCVINSCSCSNGNGVVTDLTLGTTCRTHKAEQCASCNNGFELHNDRCEYQCTCENGIAVSYPKTACGGSNGHYIRGNHKCHETKCHAGYHYNKNTETCDKNICYCQNGTPSCFDVSKYDDIGAICQKHNTDTCQACNEGYHLDDQGNGIRICKENVCTCSDGTHSTGDCCKVHDSPHCDKCNDGFFLRDDNSCHHNMCKCPNGNTVDPKDCTFNGKIQCKSCNAGYVNVNAECIKEKWGH